MLARSLIGLASMLIGLLAPRTETKERAPQPCTTWTGSVSGNDPSVAFAGQICEDKNGNVEGKLTWTSNLSGVSVRQVAGAWSKDHTSLTMHDVGFVESRPNPGWMFCLVDEYDLAGDRSALAGSYHSAKCHDDARVTLSAAK